MEDSYDWIDVVKSKKNKKQQQTKFEQKNLKTILCSNIIAKNVCSYGNNCLYAHSISEQNIDNSRKIGYDIILSSTNLNKIDLQNDLELYNSLLFFTNVCDMCIKKKCTGGYNCKYGVCLKKYCVCLTDLNYGNCNSDCGLIHLTKRGLKPFNNKKIEAKELPEIKEWIDLKKYKKDDDDIKKYESVEKYKIIDNESITSNKSTKSINSTKSIMSNKSSISDISNMSEILTDNQDEYDESIFSK
jgi:hypothetical protein